MSNFFKVYIELLEYDRYLNKNGTSLRKEDRDKYLKLLDYSVKLSDHVNWQQKTDYLNLMKNFVNLEINGKQFVNKFYKLHRSNEEIVKTLQTNIKKLNNLTPNPKSFGFTEWTSEIDLACDEFYYDFQPQDKVKFAFARDEKNL